MISSVKHFINTVLQHKAVSALFGCTLKASLCYSQADIAKLLHTAQTFWFTVDKGSRFKGTATGEPSMC